LGTDDATLVDIITHRPNEHLQAVSAEYLTTFNKSIIDDIKGDTSGDYRDLLVALVEPRPVFIARTIHNAVKGLGTNEGAIIDCLVHQPNAYIKAVHDAYHRLFNKNIIDDIVSDTSGDFKKLLVGLLNATRDESKIANVDQALRDAENLYKKGEGKIGTDEAAFIEFFTSRSYAQIAEVNRIYTEKYKNSLAVAITKEFSGDIRRGLKALATPVAEYWASRIYGAIRGIGTNDTRLIRAFVLNNKEQLRAIEQAYVLHHQKKKGKKDDKKDDKKSKEKKREVSGTLEADIKGDTSGWYEKTLLALLH